MYIITATDPIANTFIEIFNLKSSRKDGLQDIRSVTAARFTMKIYLNTNEDPDKRRPPRLNIRCRLQNQSAIWIYDVSQHPRLRYAVDIYLFAVILYCRDYLLGMRRVADITRYTFQNGEFRLRENEFKACTLSRAFKRLENIKAYCETYLDSRTMLGEAGEQMIQILMNSIQSDNPRKTLDELDLTAYFQKPDPIRAPVISVTERSMEERCSDLLNWMKEIGLVTQQVMAVFDSVIENYLGVKQGGIISVSVNRTMRTAVAVFLPIFRAAAKEFYLKYGRWLL